MGQNGLKTNKQTKRVNKSAQDKGNTIAAAKQTHSPREESFKEGSKHWHINSWRLLRRRRQQQNGKSSQNVCKQR